MKKTLISLELLATLNTNSLQVSEALFNVSKEIHQEVGSIFSQCINDDLVRFERLVSLADELTKLNQCTNNKYNWTKSDIGILLIIDSVLDFTFDQFKDKYAQLIYSTYTEEFRYFASVRNTFKANLKLLNERLNGVKIAEFKNLSLSQFDLDVINTNAKLLEEKIIKYQLNSHCLVIY